MVNSKARILVVDDDPDLLNINSSILQSSGLEVIEASTGNECISIAREILPDVILLDVNLPDTNGFDVCKQIKADPLLANTYVILISGIEISSKSKVYGLDLGADEYLIRPISGRELLARVKAMIRIKDAEIALRKSKEQYQMLVETMNEGIWALNEIGVITFVNERICEIVGCTREEIIGHPVADFFDDGNQEMVKEEIEKRGKGSGMPCELAWTRKDGRTIYCTISPKPLFDNRGRYKGSFAVVTDITKRKETEEEINKLNEELERRVVDRTMQLEAVVKELESEIIERKRIEEDLRIKEIAIASSINAIAFADLEGTLTYVNNAFLQLWGYETESDILNKPIMFCWHEGEKADKVMEDLSARGWCMGAMVGRREDGSTFDAQFSANVVSDANGSPLCVEASFIDITERKKTEEAMVQYAERLQSLSTRLLEVQESERRYIAQELHDEIGQVLTGLSLSLEHIGSLPSDSVQEKLNEAQTLVRELSSKVRNISLDLRPSMLDDLGLLPALLWHFDRYTSQTNIAVRFRHEGLNVRFRPEVETAAYRIIQEALTNVARYAGVKEVEVTMMTHQDTFHIKVEDKGTGFLPEQSLRKKSSAGLTGIYERLSLLNGKLIIDSSPGQGTRLMIDIPLIGFGK
jgi:PAS domain S-box-containing protein